MLKTVKRILIIKLRDIGDIVLSTPVIKVLYDNCPSPEIVYVLKKEYENFKYLLPNVREVITYDKNDPLDFLRVVMKLRRYRFDIAVNLHATYRSALMTLLAGAKLRLVHNHSGKNYFSSVPLNIEEKAKNIIERDLDTISPLRLAEVTKEQKRPELKLNDEYIRYIEDEEFINTVGLGIGAKRPSKMWDKERFAELGKRLKQAGYNVAVFCSAKEAKDGEFVAKAIGGGTRLFAGLDFLRLGFFLRKMRLFVGNDSGLRHMAAALSAKTVTLFGPENPVEWHPYSAEDGHIAVIHEQPCINCARDICPEKHHNCMKSITVDEVFAAVEKLAGQPGK